MTVAIIIYFLLLIVFFVVGGLIVRHAVKFGYLSSKFKTVVLVFGIIALGIIIFSIYLLFLGGDSAPNDYYEPYTETATSSGDLNF